MGVGDDRWCVSAGSLAGSTWTVTPAARGTWCKIWYRTSFAIGEACPDRGAFSRILDVSPRSGTIIHQICPATARGCPSRVPTRDARGLVVWG
jgi:hypothetical protein